MMYFAAFSSSCNYFIPKEREVIHVSTDCFVLAVPRDH